MSKVVTRMGVEIDLSYAHKCACPKCRKEGGDWDGDNLQVYGSDSEGKHKGAFCWACGYKILSEEYLEAVEGDVEEEWVDIMGREFNDEIHELLKARTGVDSKDYRGVPKAISKWFGVRYSYSEEDGSVVETLYPCTKDYKISGYKRRGHPKDFASPYGETGQECDLFGQFRFKTFSNTVVIVGGEHDQLAAYTMLDQAQKNKSFDPAAVVSSTTGESGAYKQIQKQYEFFNRFKKIVLCFDNDEAGRAAQEKVVDVLPKGRVFIMKLRYKDPNQYLINGKESEFISDFWSAKPYTPEGVKSASDGLDEIKDELMKERITLPEYMHVMQGMMGGGIIQGRILNVIADTSAGKSTHVNRMVYHWIFNSPVTPTIVSLEATAAQYMIEMLSIHLEKNLLWKMTGEEILEFLETDEGKKAQHELAFKENGEPRFYIIDDRTGSIKDLEVELEMLFRKHNSKLFVIDVLTDLLRGGSEQHSEDHMSFQRNMAKNGVTIANVMHTRKPQQSADGTIRKVTEYDALGTGSFVQSAAYNVVLNRDKLSEDNVVRNTTIVDLPKCRGGKTGAAGNWFFSFDTSQCYDLVDYLRDNPHLKPMEE